MLTVCGSGSRGIVLVNEVVGGGEWYRLERTDSNVTLVVTGPWTSEAADAISAGAADGLDLNYAKGFKDVDLQFLRDWPLKRLSLLARTAKDMTPLRRVAPTVESLSVQ